MTVLSGASTSPPQPGLPRRQIPAVRSLSSFFATSATSGQVGFGGRETPPACSNSFLLYMRKDDSP